MFILFLQLFFSARVSGLIIRRFSNSVAKFKTFFHSFVKILQKSAFFINFFSFLQQAYPHFANLIRLFYPITV